MCQVILSRVKSWTWQQLSLTNSFVIQRYPCWAMCLWPPSKAGGQVGWYTKSPLGVKIDHSLSNLQAASLQHITTPLLRKMAIIIPLCCWEEVLKSCPIFYVISQIIISHLSSVQIKSWKFSITQVKSFLFSSCRCANKLVKKFSITKTLEVSIE
jgi:hypothetical protein